MQHKINPVFILRICLLAVLAVILVFPSQRAQAAACTSAQAGNWSEAATWANCGGGVPGSGDTASIGHAVTVDANTTIVSLAITSGGSLTLGANLTLTGTGSYILDLAGNINLGNHQMELSGNGGNIRVCGSTTNTISGSSGAIFLMTATTQTTKNVVTTDCSTAGTLTFGSNVNVHLSSPTWDYSRFNPGSGLTTINGELRLYYGGGVVTNSPAYGSNATLAYETDQDITVGTEWATGTSGAGVPQNVVLAAGNDNVIFPSDNMRAVLGDITLGSGSKITLASCSACHLSFRGDTWTNNGGTIEGSSSKRVIFEGTELQVIGGTSTTDFPNLEIKNSSTDGVFLQITATVRRHLYMTDGNLDLDVRNITIGYAGNIIYSPAGSDDADKMVIADQGKLCKTFGDGATTYGPFSFRYTIGDHNGYYSPVDMALPDISSEDDPYDAYSICLQVYNTDHPNFGSHVTTNYLNRYWKITRTGYGGETPLFTADFEYVDDDIIGTETEIYSTRWDNTSSVWTWYDPVDDTNNYVQVAGVSMLSEADYTGQPEAPTSVTMADMQAIPAIGQVLVRWTTALELNTLGFNIYRSTSLDGARILLTPTEIPSQAPGQVAGTSYEFVDATAQAGVTYYYWIEEIDDGMGRNLFGPLQTVLLHYIHLPLLMH